ncbi:hypothetical protein ACFYTQ_31695 [Nocardia sp. NPDC004068]|uniref:hypothetical protein n=1 Tax=Nocardia sp. NPDC004068 TaxID=3364303 RepID=UPI00368032D7
MISIDGGNRFYQCDFCLAEATVLDTGHGHFCQRCADGLDFSSPEFLTLLDGIDASF